VAISNDIIVAGAYLKNTDNTDGLDTGAVYLFQRTQGGSSAWGEIKKLMSSDSSAGDRFGFSVAIHHNMIAIGAYLENHDTNSDTVEDLNAGAAYLFKTDSSTQNNWHEIRKLIANQGAANDYMAFSVALSNNAVGVGIPLHDNSSMENAGAIYIFQ
jgi:hypothetical protein